MQLPVKEKVFFPSGKSFMSTLRLISTPGMNGERQTILSPFEEISFIKPI